MTHVKFKVDPLLRKTSEDPRMVVLGSGMITRRMNYFMAKIESKT